MGSSPLARGLPDAARNILDRVRIIPARAGFTSGPRSSRRCPPDHPRSRGVYEFTRDKLEDGQGSSPLARGLRRVPDGRTGLLRIIPARAGFTCPPSYPCTRNRDHPRSRGVYLPLTPVMNPLSGSSPLARGLPVILPVKMSGHRIIPARAGFTVGHVVASGSVPDHPRSRGVYQRSTSTSPPRPGSSPLARGLLSCSSRLRFTSRIIPARAGFTHPWRRPPARWRDHPRSRGVYMVLGGPVHRRRGSSPLARGLRDWAGEPARPGGIIPARAGFTRGGFEGGASAQDHPRSRGVYASNDCTDMRRAGSSPLARGLQKRRAARKIRRRIIPARAGFTHLVLLSEIECGDHPRSRGVYTRTVSASTWAAGSSPLARGLPVDRQVKVKPPRIIPARAGFTGCGPPARGRRPDHPRSRGVYLKRRLTVGVFEGSSPLARGLLQRRDRL